MLIVKIDQNLNYTVHVDSLWEQSDSDWFRRLRDSGLPVNDVRKVLHEGRGCLRFDFYEPVEVGRFQSLVEAAVPAGERPLKDHIYRVKKAIIARTLAPALAMEPVRLDKGVAIKEVEKLSSQQWVMLVLSGDYVGSQVLIGDQEWIQLSKDLDDLGTEFTMGGATQQELEDPSSSPSADLTEPGKNPGPAGAFPASTPLAKKPKRKTFPEFRKRKPLSSYRSTPPKKK